MSELLWPTLFNPMDCVEDAWDQRREMRVRRFGDPNPGTVTETRIELRVGDRIRRSEPRFMEGPRWYEYTPLTCGRCDLPFTYGHRDGDALGHCPCPRCGSTRYAMTSYEVCLDEVSIRRKRLEKRLSHVVGTDRDPATGHRILTFQLEDECGSLEERVIRLRAGAQVPAPGQGVDHDALRCTRCGRTRAGARPIGERERCPSCGNPEWEIHAYREDFILTADEMRPPDTPPREEGGTGGCGWAALFLLALAGLGYGFLR